MSVIGIDNSVLLSYLQARTGQTSLGLTGVAGATASSLAKKSPTPPWLNTAQKAPEATALVRSLLAGRDLIDEEGTQLDVKGASEDYRKLFALHQGLAGLQALAKRADAKGLSASELANLQKAFDRGLAEVSTYVDAAQFDQLRMTQGDAANRARMSVGVPRASSPSYVTPPLHSGSSGVPVAAFQGDVAFDLTVKRVNSSQTVHFDLNEMGSTPRTMGAVVQYMNSKLEADGFTTRFSVEKIAGQAKTMQVSGRTVTISPAVDQFALKITGNTSETLSFSAASTAPAVYLAQTSGSTNPDGKAATNDSSISQQLLKFETGSDPAADAARRPGDANWVEGRVFSNTLPPEVAAVRSTTTGPDGAVYVLADLTGKFDGQTIKGQGDVALLKYDSAGQLVYTRTLGATQDADGFSVAVGADGRVAIAGSVTGGLVFGSDGSDKTKTDGFVTVFDAQGQELWTKRQSTSTADAATQVAFAADGALYVLGRTSGVMGAPGVQGSEDAYLRTYAANGAILSTQQFGSAGTDKPAGLAIDGANVYVATQESGSAVLRRFDMTDPRAPVVAAVRSLGDLGGGNVAGIAVDGGKLVVAGTSGDQISVGQPPTRASSGGFDGFAATLDLSLSADPADALAFFGGTGDDRVTAMTASGGKVWLAGTSAGDLPGLAKVGKQDGFALELDVAAGTTGWAQRFTAVDGRAAPTAIAVDATGSSALDRLGLPRGQIAYSESQRITAATSTRAGDQFQLRTREGGAPVTITISDNDTLETLATKIRRASVGVKVTIMTQGDKRFLSIQPASDNYTVEVLAGPKGRDALGALGLSEGYVRNTKTVDGKAAPADGGDPIFALKLDRLMSIGDKAGVKHATEELEFAMSIVRSAYRDLDAKANPQAAAPPAAQPSAYQKAQLANYQAALDRLTA